MLSLRSAQVRFLLVSLGSLFTAISAFGTIIAPGQTGVPPDVLGISTPNGLLALTFETYTTSTFTGGEGEWKFSDPINTLPGCLDCLNFLFIIRNTGTSGAVDRVTLSSFSGFTTDAGYNLSGFDGPIPGPIPPLPVPISMDRSVDGSVVGLNFGGAGITPGEVVYLDIETNATAYGTGGSVSIAGGGMSVSESIFAPVPEPAERSLLLCTVSLVLAARWHRLWLRRRVSCRQVRGLSRTIKSTKGRLTAKDAE